MAASRYFPRHIRLTQAADFTAAFRAGQRQSGRYFAVLTRANEFPYPRLGMIVAKKAIRRAVARNRIKRILRESFRHHQELLAGIDIVVTIYRHIAPLNKNELRLQFDKQWEKLISCKKA
jgi:ribonuclease P protein component